MNLTVDPTRRGLVRSLVRLVIETGAGALVLVLLVDDVPFTMTKVDDASAWLASAVTPALRAHTAIEYVPATVGCQVNVELLRQFCAVFHSPVLLWIHHLN